MKKVPYATALLFTLFAACDENSSPTAPTTPTAPQASTPTTLGAGNVSLSSVNSSDACSTAYLRNHPDTLAQPVTAELKVQGTDARLILAIGGQPQCIFTGTSSSGKLDLHSSHETCAGFPLSGPALSGILEAGCHSYDPRDDGFYWGFGSLVGEISENAIVGHWSYRTYDPGSLKLDVDLLLELSPQ
jgi:hypothetical protein